MLVNSAVYIGDRCLLFANKSVQTKRRWYNVNCIYWRQTLHPAVKWRLALRVRFICFRHTSEGGLNVASCNFLYFRVEKKIDILPLIACVTKTRSFLENCLFSIIYLYSRKDDGNFRKNSKCEYCFFESVTTWKGTDEVLIYMALRAVCQQHFDCIVHIHMQILFTNNAIRLRINNF